MHKLFRILANQILKKQSMWVENKRCFSLWIWVILECL